MFDLVPSGRVKCQLIEGREVPKYVGGGEGDPTDHGMEQQAPDSFQRGPNKKGPDDLASEHAG
jgi:hypothetical protein